MKNIFKTILCLLISTACMHSYANNNDNICANINNRINQQLGNLTDAFLKEANKEERNLILCNIMEYILILENMEGSSSINSLIEATTREKLRLEKQGVNADVSMILAIKTLEKKHNFNCNARECFSNTPYRIEMQ